MAIWYVDFEGEAGTGDGTSFANRAKSIKALYNIASERDVGTQYSGGGANGANTIGQADEIRIKKSPDPTLVGQGQVWKDLATNDYNYTLNNMGTITYSATKGQTTIVKNDHGLKTNEWVKIHNNSNSDAFINGWWKVTRVDANTFSLNEYTANSTRVSAGTGNGGNCFFMSGNMVELDNKVIEEVAFSSRAAIAAAAPVMTAQSNVTCSVPNAESSWSSSWQTNGGQQTNPEGGQKINISNSFTGTGKACHMQLPSTKNLSSYQQISLQFFFRGGDDCAGTYHNNPTYITQGFSLRLCTDNNGDTPVHTIPLNYHKIRSTYRIIQITKDFGANLNSNINSIAIYVDTARNVGREFDIGNIIACKASSSADAITHASLIGLNTTAAPQWYRCANIFNANNKTVIKCEEGSEQARGRCAPGYYGQGCVYRWWPQSYNANESGSTSIQIYKREDFWFQLQAQNNVNNNSNGSKFLALNAANHPLIISGGWNTTDMSTKNAGDMTFIDGGTCELGDAYISSTNSSHSSGSGGSYHADGEDKIAHIEDLYMSRFYGYWQYYRKSMSLCNVGCYNWATGFYLYFTYRIKKFGLIILGGHDKQTMTSYHGINFGLHSQGGGTYNAQFLLDSDGTKHSTYDKTTRYIKWAAGSGDRAVVRIGYSAGQPQIDNVEFSVINTELHYRNAGFQVSTGPNSKLEIENLYLGYGDSDVSYAMYVGNTIGAPVYVQNMYSTGCDYGAMNASNGYGDIVIQNWQHTCLGIYKNNERYRTEYQGGFSFSARFYDGSKLTVMDGDIETRPITYSDSIFQFNSLLIRDGNEDVYNHSGIAEVTNHQNISGNNYKFVDGGLIYPESSIRKTASGYALKMKTYGYNTVANKVASIVFNGGTQVTVSIWYYKGHQYFYGELYATNFTVNSGLALEKTSDIGYNTNNPNQWVQATLTFTPTGAGSCDIYFGLLTQSSGSTNNSFYYLDDLTISQA